VTDLPAEVFLDQLASGTPAPGGGAAAALTGAAGAALVGMVCRVTAARSSASAMVAEAQRDADELRAHLVALIGEDASAVGAMLAAHRARDPQEAAALPGAVRRATEVPLEIARASRQVLGLADQVAAHARPSALPDLGVAGMLASAALEASGLLARVNARDTGDPGFAATVGEALARLVRDGLAHGHRLQRTVAERTGLQA
jgi:formiminotetrahydrofolate cyclodeaminase